MASRPTIRDVARLAGVSTTTVSRVLNGKPDVDPATRERVLQLMDELAFVPSVAAAGLAAGRSRLIGVLLPSLTWPLFADILRGVAEAMEMSPYELVLYSISHERDRCAMVDRIIASNLVSGLIAIYPDGSNHRDFSSHRETGQVSHHLGVVHERGFPVVTVDDQGPQPLTPWITVDSRSGTRELTARLIEQGHTHIAYIQGPDGYLCSAERYRGYCEALEAAGLSPDPTLAAQGNFDEESGITSARGFFALRPRPTAIIAANDQMAYGVLRAAADAGLRVPDDLSVAGYDDISPSAHLQPALTTVKQPFYEMGQSAVSLLISILNKRQAITPWQPGRVLSRSGLASAPVVTELSRLSLPTTVMYRESTGAPPSSLTATSTATSAGKPRRAGEPAPAS